MIKKILFILMTSFFLSSAYANDSKDAHVAPSFSLRSTKGKLISLEDYKGKVVLLNFWASWCAPCITELPHMQKIYESLKSENFIVLGINIDEARHASGIKPLAKKLNLEFPILFNNTGSVLSLYNPSMTIPYSVIIDKNGNIYAYFIGYHHGLENEIKKAVEEAIDKDKG